MKKRKTMEENYIQKNYVVVWGRDHHCPLNEHSTLGSLSTCPLGAEVNDRLGLCEREGEGGLKKIREQLMLEKREFCCLFLCDHPLPPLSSSVPGVLLSTRRPF